MIVQQRFSYNINTSTFRAPHEGDTVEGGFMLRVRLSQLPIDQAETTIFKAQGVRVLTRMLRQGHDAPVVGDYEYGEHYLSHCDLDGRCPVLEAEMCFDNIEHPQWHSMRIGIPLTLYDAVSKDAFFVYDGLHMRWIMEGELLNENMPFGAPVSPRLHGLVSDAAYVVRLDYTDALSAVERVSLAQTLQSSINYYHPHGYNAWAGDVSGFYHEGVYHLVYFIDRHHHKNRWGTGAHSFRHITTRDFATWIDHGPLFELDAPWQTVGTGTMFFYQDRYYFSYGYHTGRVAPKEKLGSTVFESMYAKTGNTRAVSHQALASLGLVPNGANYATSEDGLYFTQGAHQYHWIENPSIYSQADGLRMYTGNGTWAAEDIKGPWRLLHEGFPPSGAASSLHSSAECPSSFSWNGFSYLLMGATGFWRTEKNDEVYFDAAAQGQNIYDGLYVPMATKINDNRVVLVGWIHGIGWGSYIVHRELIQYANGRLGMKWMPELWPDKGAGPLWSEVDEPEAKMTFVCREKTSYYFEVDLMAETGRGSLCVHFGGVHGCALLLDLDREQVQFSSGTDGWPNPIEPAFIGIPQEKMDPTMRYSNLKGHYHFRGQDFSIAHVDVMRGEFTLRFVQHFSPKGNLTLIDAEIARQRTIISNRVGLIVQQVSLQTQGDMRVLAMRVYAAESEMPF